MRIDILTLFPDMFKEMLNESIIKRAIESKKVTVNLINILNEKNQVILTTCNQVKKGYQLIIEASLVK